MAKETKEKEVTTDKKDQLLADALKAIEKEYGKGSIMRLGDRADVSIDAIPSGSLALDLALGIGGYPKGRIIEIYGPESSGKTTLALHDIREKIENELTYPGQIKVTLIREVRVQELAK